MSVVTLMGVDLVSENPAKLTDNFVFNITFECHEELKKDLEWKVTYSIDRNEEHDQKLEELSVGPIPLGINKFPIEFAAPDVSKIPASSLYGVNVLMIEGLYDGREFVRVGYYVNNEYEDSSLNEPENRPEVTRIDEMKRNVLAEKPRVTHLRIKWDSEESAPAEFPPEQPEADLVADGDQYGAEEAEEEEAELAAAEAEAKEAAGGDSEMAGVEQNGDQQSGLEVDEESDDGSVDLEAESEDDLEDEDEVEGQEEFEDEAMDVDADDNKDKAGQPTGAAPVPVAS